jgi:hypothetical protein
MNSRTYINGFGVRFGPEGFELEEGADEATRELCEKLYGVKAPAVPPADPPADETPKP